MFKFLAAVLICAALVFPAIAAERSLYWDAIQTDIYLNEDSSFNVIERLEYVFNGEWNGGFRSISFKGLDNISAVELWEDKLQYIEGSLDKYHFTAGKNNGRMEIKWRSRKVDEPPYQNARKTFVLKYRVDGALNYLDGHDELYWKAIFEEREGVVKQARAVIHLPQDVDNSKLKVTLFTGAQGAAWKVQDNRTIVFSANNLPPGELFEVQVKFPVGVVERRFSLNKFINRRASPFVVFMFPAAAFLIMLYLFLKYGRDYDIKDVKNELSQKPSDLPPALAGTLIDERADLKEILATLVDLARRGHVQMTELTESDFELKLLKLPLNLMTFEIKLIEALFGIPLVLGCKVKMSDLNNRFYIYVGDLKNTIYDETLKLGYFAEDPRGVRNRFLIIGFLMAILGSIPLGFSFFVDWLEIGSFPTTLGLGLAAAGLVVAAFSGAMPRKTLLGSREKVKWLAFRKYLDNGKAAEKFEEYLPYAIAFGLSPQAVAAPVWYIPSAGVVGGGGVEQAFGGGRSGGAGAGRSFSVDSMLSNMGSAMTSSPASSSSGGSGGGGGGGGW